MTKKQFGTMRRWGALAGVAALLGLSAGSCSDDDGDTTVTDGAAGDSGTAGGDGAAGSGGSRADGGGGSGGSSGDAGAADRPSGSDAAGGDAGAKDGGGDAAVALSDAQILGVMVSANTGEVMAGTLAQMKATRADVKAFATMMVTDHTAANQRANMLAMQAGISAADSPTKTTLDMQAMQALNMLMPLTGMAFDDAYVMSQITMHQMVLTLIDQQLLPRAMNAALKAELMTMRGAVAMHLMEAQRLRGGADGGASGDAAAGG